MRSKVEGELQEMMKKMVKAASNVTARREVDSDGDNIGRGSVGDAIGGAWLDKDVGSCGYPKKIEEMILKEKFSP